MSEYVVENFIHAGVRVKIVQDQDAMNPRKEYDNNVGRMVCWHRRYDLGDEHSYDINDFRTREDALKHLAEDHGPIAVLLPLFLYDHSGITISTSSFSCPWDSGQVGFIFCTRAKAIETWGKKRLTKKVIEQVTKCLISEVETYDQYLTGDVYGFVIETLVRDDDGETIEDADGEELDSCWGFFGLEYAIAEGKQAAEYAGTKRAAAEQSVFAGIEEA
jgi:hypothetical protein